MGIGPGQPWGALLELSVNCLAIGWLVWLRLMLPLRCKEGPAFTLDTHLLGVTHSPLSVFKNRVKSEVFV